MRRSETTRTRSDRPARAGRHHLLDRTRDRVVGVERARTRWVVAAATAGLATAAGTDRWWVVDGRTADRDTRITGRLDWHAVWEDSTHFLVSAQGDAGRAAVLRCDLEGTCERASRLWDTPLPTEPSLYYRSPPVVLAGRRRSVGT